MTKGRPYLDSITALRGLAALGVVFFHVRIFLWVGWNEIQTNPQNYTAFDHFASWFSIPTPFLGEGVLLFFVISGFCIHYPQAGHLNKLNLRNYVCRRFFRIYPPFAITVGCSILAVLFLPWGDVSKEPWLPSLLLIQNYLPGTNSQISSNMSLWSISTEVEFYLAYPFLLLIWRKWGVVQSINIFAAVSMIAIGLYFMGLKSFAFCSLTFYIMCWAGAALAELYAKGKLAKPSTSYVFLAVACLMTGVIAQVQGHKLVMVQRLLFGGFFIVLLWFLVAYRDSISLRTSFVGRALLLLGEISYSLYLIHYPLLQVIGHIWVERFGSKPANFFIPVGFSFLAVLLACVFYHVIEKPFHRIAKLIT